MTKPKSLNSRILFFTTSPRSPFKMIPEIKLLKQYNGRKWDKQCQIDYANNLSKESFFNGTSEHDPAFSARDRINRGPKALGFVVLNPIISISKAGELFISEQRSEEVLLRQLLKFQIPSPYHTINKSIDTIFWVKPYLEIIRLIFNLEKLSFTELRIFGLQITDYHKFDSIVSDIIQYRQQRVNAANKKKFDESTLDRVVRSIYANELKNGKLKTRESAEESITKFLDTKKGNMRDYADSCIRYLRSTGLISISGGINGSISILPSRRKDVEFILSNINRDPIYVNDLDKYIDYLTDPNIPTLYSDNVDNLIESIMRISNLSQRDLLGKSHSELLNIKDAIIADNRKAIITEQMEELRSYQTYQNIIDTFDNLRNEYDPPLILEWNVWRAMAMLDDGEIIGNFKLDDEGAPMSTASGNMSDIECYYEDFGLTVEVTMSGGQKQYESESESVSRHLGSFKKKSGKQSYCLFIAPRINQSVISYFYMLHKTNIEYYGGKSILLPLELDVFRTMIENAYASKVNGKKPTSSDIKQLFECSFKVASNTNNEREWYDKMIDVARNWMKV